MDKRERRRNIKYTSAFKKQLVAEVNVSGATVPMVSKRHGVSANQIYSWRLDPRFQPDEFEAEAFTPVVITDAPDGTARAHAVHIEITLENGRKLNVSDDVDIDFVLEIARGLAL